MPFGFGNETDREQTRMKFLVLFPGQEAAPAGMQELIADGTTTVVRQPAAITDTGFHIDAQIIDMPHTGQHPLLGTFTVNVAAGPPSKGAVDGSLDPQTKQPRIDQFFPARGEFNLNLEIVTAMGTFVTGDQPMHVVNPMITTLFPDTPYNHDIQQALLNLFLKGQLTKPLAKIAAGYHYKHPHNGKHNGWEKTQDCKPCCSVQSRGHCSCFLLRDQDGLREQLVFVGSHPGLAGSPLERDRILVYETLTNEGPRAVTVYWDGLPGQYQTAGQSTLLLPGNTLTVAAGRAVKVVLAPDPTGLHGDHAKGHDVISWCCPDPWVK
jgi:hypothetical protein